MTFRLSDDNMPRQETHEAPYKDKGACGRKESSLYKLESGLEAWLKR